MPRPPSGPRRIDSSGTYFAVKTVKGKRHYISLQTKLKSEAMRRWPEAQAQLEQLTSPPKYARGQLLPITYLDPYTGAAERVLEWSDNLTRDEYLTDSDDPSLITWPKAQEIAEKRFKRRRGKEVSRSWRYNLSNALRFLDVKYPLETTPKDIRLMVERMEQLDYADSTIAIRASAIGGVLDSLIKTGHAAEDFANPIDKVDTAAISTKHRYKAQPEDYSMSLNSFYFWVVMYTGCRINEALKGDYSEAGWLKVGKHIAKNRASIREIPLPPFLKNGGVPSPSTAKDQKELAEKLAVLPAGENVSVQSPVAASDSGELGEKTSVLVERPNGSTVEASAKKLTVTHAGEIDGPNSSVIAADHKESTKKLTVQTMSDDCFRTHFNKARPHDQLTPHSFRHGWKSAARLAAADEVTSEKLLGHSVGKMNEVYGIYPRDLLVREAEKVWGVIKEWTND